MAFRREIHNRARLGRRQQLCDRRAVANLAALEMVIGVRSKVGE